MDIHEEILNEITQQITGQKSLLRYTRLDLIRFVRFWEEEKKKGKTIHQCVSEYIPTWERTTAEEKLNNIFKALDEME